MKSLADILYGCYTEDYDNFDKEVFNKQIEEQMPGYVVESWVQEDFGGMVGFGEDFADIVERIGQLTKDKTVEDIQSQIQYIETDGDDFPVFVVAIKVK